MSIQDLINIINSQLPDNNKQLITEAVLRGVLENMVNTLSSELRVFNINSSQVTDNGDGTYTLSVQNELPGAIAIDEQLNIYQYDGAAWTLKVDATMFATAEQGSKADSAVQPGDNVSILNNDAGYLTETTHDSLPQDNPHGVTASQVGLGNVDNTSDADKPVSTAQGQAINQAEANAKQYTDDEIANLNLGSAAQADVGDFATAAQGSLADTAVQPGDLATVATTGAYSDLTGTPILGTAASADTGDFATAAQGTKADTAIQPGDNMSQLNDDTNFIDDVIAGDNMTIDKTDPKKPVFYGQSAAVPEYASKNAAIADVGLGLNYPFSVEGDDTAYVKKDTGFVSTWDTTKTGVSNSDEIALPLVSGGTYNFEVWYGGQLLKTITTYTDNVITFPDGSGTKQIVCIGQLVGFRFENGGDKDKILSIEDFGNGLGGDYFYAMFWGCSNLTSVGLLDTTGVTTMSSMFREASSLTTLDVSSWDVSSVRNMSLMFFQASSLMDLPIQNWNVENVSSFSNFATGVTIPTVTYDQILNNWAAQNVQPSLSVNFGNSKYSAAGQAGRDILINTHGWIITDGGPV